MSKRVTNIKEITIQITQLKYVSLLTTSECMNYLFMFHGK